MPLLKTVPVMLPSAYALPAINKEAAKEIGNFAFIVNVVFGFWVQSYPIASATWLQSEAEAHLVKEKPPLMAVKSLCFGDVRPSIVAEQVAAEVLRTALMRVGILILAKVLVSHLQQLLETFNAIGLHLALSYPFLLVFEPVEHRVLCCAMLGGTLLLFGHEVEESVIILFPKFVLCHKACFLWVKK